MGTALMFATGCGGNNGENVGKSAGGNNRGNGKNKYAIGGALHGEFSVADGRTVRFSQGNLQYQASTNKWRFATNQYDYIGDNNSNISPTYSGWIDLFGWGTSGWNSGTGCYQPWSTSTSVTHYYPGGSDKNDLTGFYANADWGVYNAISNGGNEAGLWRTLTYEEWEYLFEKRTDAKSKVGYATVADVNGIILLPDNFTDPMKNNGSGAFVPTPTVSYYSNIYSAKNWDFMEAAGAVFLPAAGIRAGTNAINSGVYGCYWSSSSCGSSESWLMYFGSDFIYIFITYRCSGLSVRLVKD